MKLPMIVPVSRLRFPSRALVAFAFAVTMAAGRAGAETTTPARPKGSAAHSTAAAPTKGPKTRKTTAAGHPEPKGPKRDEPKVASAPPLALQPLTPLAVQPQPALPPIAPVTPIPMATPTPTDGASASEGVTSGTGPAPSGQGVGPDHGTSPLPETPDEQNVQAVIKQNAAGVRACYLRLQRSGVQITGKALVSFLISPEGRPEGLKIDAPAFAGTTLPECVAQQLSRWAFPKSQKGATFPITYPFVFVGS